MEAFFVYAYSHTKFVEHTRTERTE